MRKTRRKPHPLSIVPKGRLDALTDGLFAITMTLLVIEIKLPENFHPKDAQELTHAILELLRSGIAFFISFFVLGIRWLGIARLMHGLEHVSRSFARWSLLHLFLTACIPFSTMLVGRYTEFPISIWIYAANMSLGGLVAMRLYAEPTIGKMPWYKNENARSLLWLLAATTTSVVISFFNPMFATLAYILTLPTARPVPSQRG
jgi:uncharacterized membrane protein